MIIFVVIEPLHWSVSIYDRAEQYESDLANFTPEQRHVFACHWYLSEAQRLGGQPSLLREERQQQLENLEPDFSDLDRRLFKLEEKIDVNGKLLAYMRNHREQFYFSGLVETL